MKYYQTELQAIYQELEASENGLSREQAQKKLEAEGPNELQATAGINRWRIFVNQFKSFIIYIMLFAGALSLAVGEYADAAVIGVILLANALIGYYQEVSAQESLEALKQMSIVQAKVLRDGEVRELDSKELVRGDVVLLEPGDRVPADCRLLEASSLKIEESALTGESLAVEKKPGKLNEDAQAGEQHNMVFSSTTVQEGTAKAVVVKTGMDTEIGKITELVQSAEEELTPLQKRLDRFGKKLGWAVIGICFVVFLAIGYQEYNRTGVINWQIVADAGLVAVALAVAAVPSGLPAVVTIALSVGVKKLLKQKALVRRLASVETLGSCNVICSDKTGTLTKNEMTVKKVWSQGKETSVEGVGYAPEGALSGEIDPLIFEIGLYCNNASLYQEEGQWQITGDATEAALLVSARKAGLQKDKNQLKRLKELPFDSDRKRMSVLVDRSGKQQVLTKGAPDNILESCTSVLKDGKAQPLTDEEAEKIQQQINQFSSQALRVLAFAFKNSSELSEDGLTFVGLQAMIDPPRPDVKDSIQRTKNAGIRVIMITGDYKETARAIGQEIGIEGKVLSGKELDTMSDQDLKRHLDQGTNVFARVIPEHKQRIIQALQEQGNVVAMTGDGVNDAPALKKANIGVAVGSGTDVAKEASDFVLTDDSFTNIVNAVEEGRGIYDNIQKAIMHLLSGNLSEVLIIFIATVLGFGVPMTAIMLLWINLVTDGAPALTLAVDPYGHDIMKRKPKSGEASILPKPEFILIGVLGVFATVAALVLFIRFSPEDAQAAGSTIGSELNVAQTTVFTFIVFSEFIILLAARAWFKTPLFTNKWLWVSMAGGLVLQALIIYTPFRQVLTISELGAPQLTGIGIAAAAMLLASWLFMLPLRKKYGI